MKIKEVLLALLVTVQVAKAQQIKVVFYDPNTSVCKDRYGLTVTNPKVPGTLIIQNNYNSLTSSKTPLLVVHGYTDNGMSMLTNWQPVIGSNGIKSGYISTLPVGDVYFNGLIIKKAIDSLVKIFSVPQISIIAHSRGGVDVDMALYRHNAARRVAGVYTFGSPHRGGAVPDAASNWLISLISSAIQSGISNATVYSTNSFNTASLAYYWANSSSYIAQKKINSTTTINVNPQTDTYTRWWTHYANDYGKHNAFAYKVAANYMWGVANSKACNWWQIMWGCRGDGANDGVVENFSSKRAYMSGVGSYYFTSNNGDHSTMKNSDNNMQGEVIPYLHISSSLSKLISNKPNEIVEPPEPEKNSFATSANKIIGALNGTTEFIVEEDNIDVSLNLFTLNKPMFVEIKSIQSDIPVTGFKVTTSEAKGEDEILSNGLFASEIKLSNLPKGKYKINLQEPFYGFTTSQNYNQECATELGFKDSEGFSFNNNKGVTVLFSGPEKLNFNSITAYANVRKISELDGTINSLNEFNKNYSLPINIDNTGYYGKITDDLTSGYYNISVEVEGGDQTSQYISRTLTKTFFVDKAMAMGVNENKQKETLSIYPNPANTDATINLSEIAQSYALEIISLTGSVIYSEENGDFNNKKININLSDLKNGVYILKIKTDKKEFNSKLIINK